MAWVKEEYAGEFAVLSTWLVGLLPWGVSFWQIRGLDVVSFRFLFVRLQYIFGAAVAGEAPFLWVWQVPGFEATPELTLTANLGLVAAAVYLVPLTISVAYYVDEDRVESVPVDPVRVIGALLGVVGMLVTAAALLFARYRAGLALPVAPPFVLALSYLLLTVDRT